MQEEYFHITGPIYVYSNGYSEYIDTDSGNFSKTPNITQFNSNRMFDRQ